MRDTDRVRKYRSHSVRFDAWVPTRRRSSPRRERGTIGEGDVGQDHQAARLQDLRRARIEARPIEVERALDRQHSVHRCALDAGKTLGFSQAERQLVCQVFQVGPLVRVANLSFRDVEVNQARELVRMRQK